MASTIETAFQNSYHNEFEIQYQQNGSRLRPFVTVRPQVVKADFHDRIGKRGRPQQRTARFAPTVLDPAVHTRIRITMEDFRDAIPFEDEDKMRMNLNDPRFEYARIQAQAMGRELDYSIITAATGTTYTGETGATAETYVQATYGIAVNAVAPGAAAVDSNLTLEKLIQTKSLLKRAEAIGDGEPVVFVCTQKQLDSLLRTTEVTNADYNSIKTLTTGMVNTFMGFTFIQTELLSIDASNVRTCLAFPKSAIMVGEAMERSVSIDRRPDLNNTWQVLTKATFGATRTWLDKVVAVLCDEDVA